MKQRQTERDRDRRKRKTGERTATTVQTVGQQFERQCRHHPRRPGWGFPVSLQEEERRHTDRKDSERKDKGKREKKVFFIKKMVVIGISNSRANNLRRKLSKQ